MNQLVKNIRKVIESMGYTVDINKVIDRSNAVCTALSILTIASICKHGFKEHMKRAYSEPLKQFALGGLIEILIILSCVEKK